MSSYFYLFFFHQNLGTEKSQRAVQGLMNNKYLYHIVWCLESATWHTISVPCCVPYI